MIARVAWTDTVCKAVSDVSRSTVFRTGAPVALGVDGAAGLLTDMSRLVAAREPYGLVAFRSQGQRRTAYTELRDR